MRKMNVAKGFGRLLDTGTTWKGRNRKNKQPKEHKTEINMQTRFKPKTFENDANDDANASQPVAFATNAKV